MVLMELRPVYQPSGRRAGGLGMDADRLGDLAPLLGLRHVPVLDPLQAVAGDVPAGLLHGRDDLRIALQRGGDAEHRGRHACVR